MHFLFSATSLVFKILSEGLHDFSINATFKFSHNSASGREEQSLRRSDSLNRFSVEIHSIFSKSPNFRFSAHFNTYSAVIIHAFFFCFSSSLAFRLSPPISSTFLFHVGLLCLTFSRFGGITAVKWLIGGSRAQFLDTHHWILMGDGITPTRIDNTDLGRRLSPSSPSSSSLSVTIITIIIVIVITINSYYLTQIQRIQEKKSSYLIKLFLEPLSFSFSKSLTKEMGIITGRIRENQ